MSTEGRNGAIRISREKAKVIGFLQVGSQRAFDSIRNFIVRYHSVGYAQLCKKHLASMRDASASAVERTLLALLLEQQEARCRSETQPIRCDDHALLTSTWQKCIRRGDVQMAVSCAMALHSQDPSYVWRRIRGIAMEEVSIADLTLVAQVLAIAGKRKLQGQVGERALLSHLTERLTLAPKSRTACDLLVWANHHPLVASYRRKVLAQTEGAIVTPDALDWKSAARVQLIAGLSRYVHGRWVAVSQGSPVARERWLDEMSAPPLIRFVACRGSGTDALNLLTVLVWQLTGGCGTTGFAPEQGTLAHASIGGIPAYGWCFYSAPGRETLRSYIASDEPLARAIRDCEPRSPVAALGHLIFHAQGSYCKQTLRLSGRDEIRAFGERTSLEHAGIHEHDIPRLRNLLRSSWPAINCTRRAVAVRRGWQP